MARNDAASTISATATPNSGQRRATDRGHGEADVHQRVALLQETSRLQDRRNRATRKSPAGDGESAVEQPESEDEREEERTVGDHRQRRERGGFHDVERRKAAPQRQLIESGGQRGRDERRQELRGDEERCCGRNRLRLVVDEYRKRHDADGVPELVDRIRSQQPAEGPYGQWCKAPPHPGNARASRNRHPAGRMSIAASPSPH